mmetsp:Transcript_86428/g.245036  ORF Transcript_86428/g.245036 Transcript_86428/m.245036 type:complete len:234 (+) Transcript_86428:706-1407(+)
MNSARRIACCSLSCSTWLCGAGRPRCGCCSSRDSMLSTRLFRSSSMWPSSAAPPTPADAWLAKSCLMEASCSMIFGTTSFNCATRPSMRTSTPSPPAISLWFACMSSSSSMLSTGWFHGARLPLSASSASSLSLSILPDMCAATNLRSGWSSMPKCCIGSATAGSYTCIMEYIDFRWSLRTSSMAWSMPSVRLSRVSSFSAFSRLMLLLALTHLCSSMNLASQSWRTRSSKLA